MKVQEVILRGMAKSITWWQAAEIIGISDRSMGRWRRLSFAYVYAGPLAIFIANRTTLLTALTILLAWLNFRWLESSFLNLNKRW